MSTFNFKHFKINQTNSALKIGTDAFLLGALTDFSKSSHILDIGTGTGVLSLIAAQSSSKAKIIGLEIDEINSSLARENFSNSEWSDRLSLVHVDLKDFRSDFLFDLIISNPPYFQNSTKTNLNRKDLAKHNDSLSAKTLFNFVNQLITKQGEFWCILPFDHSKDYISEAENNRFYINQKVLIYGKPHQLKRIIYTFSKQEKPLIIKELTVRNESGKYSDEYKSLTEELHDRPV